jgi:phage terminase large subunit-like protein
MRDLVEVAESGLADSPNPDAAAGTTATDDPLAGLTQDQRDAVIQAMLDNPERADEIAAWATDPSNLHGLEESAGGGGPGSGRGEYRTRGTSRKEPL